LLWDESYSTHQARQARLSLGSPKRKRQGHLDDLAATVILQSFLDAHFKEE
jgi:putative Holliday junction resolvase